MKRSLLIGLMSGALILAGVIGSGTMKSGLASAEKETQKYVVQEAKSSKERLLGIEKAVEIALAHIDEQGGSVEIESVELERDDGKLYYEIEMRRGSKEYELYVHAYTGEVLKLEIDHNDDYRSHKNKQVISLQEAAAIAAKNVNGTVVEIELDHDDGRLIYEVELKTAQGNAEVDIDAYTGKILDVEYDD